MTPAPIHLELHDQSLRHAMARACRQTSLVAIAFAVIVSTIVLGSVLRQRSDDWLEPDRLQALKRQLASDPSSDSLKQQIRSEDERLRLSHVERQSFLIRGGWLLLGGAIVAAGCAKLAGTLESAPYFPTGSPPVEARWSPAMRRGVVVATAALLGAMLLLRLPSIRGISFARVAPRPILLPMRTPTPAPPATRPAEIAVDAQWPCFRGPNGVGVASGDYPTQWDAATGKNILWKAAVPLPGNNSPIVAGNRVFLSGGTEQRREVYCFDALTGSLVWSRPAGAAGPNGMLLSEDTGWAPSTMACDGRRVFAIFPTGELACFSVEGRPLWTQSLGVPKNQYGHASSLLVSRDLLFVQFDQGLNAHQNLSALYAFECATGKQRWRVSRPVGASWSTPAIVPGPAGPQLVTLANPWIIAYDPNSGAGIWRAKALAGEIVPSPAFSGGLLFAAVEQANLVAIRLDGHGDVTASHVRKIDAEDLPDIVSPVAIGSRVLLAGSSGMVCLADAASGKTVWSQEMDGGFHASPIAVGSNVYLTDLAGVTHVIAIGDAYKELAHSPLGEDVAATPAFAAGRIYLRGKTHLFCIGAGGKGAGQ